MNLFEVHFQISSPSYLEIGIIFEYIIPLTIRFLTQRQTVRHMIEYAHIFEKCRWNRHLSQWGRTLPDSLRNILDQKNNKLIVHHLEILSKLPKLPLCSPQIRNGAVSFCSDPSVEMHHAETIKAILLEMKPWRKGPYHIHGCTIDAEWKAHLKWDRIVPYLSPLKNRTVLDIGASNGYYSWRIFEQGATFTIGIEPYLPNFFQFHAVNHFASPLPITVLPFRLEQMPRGMEAFDTVFNMGVLYHQRSPFDHILHCKELLKSGGEFVLETMVIEGSAREVLVPLQRYSKMRNVWFLPSAQALESWLAKCGFVNIKTVDISRTDSDEQRKTEWMDFETLSDFLDSSDPSKTIEGYPAPLRATVIAEKP